MIEARELDIPAPSRYMTCDFDPLPYVFVGDEIFPLKTWLMRPYPGKLTKNNEFSNARWQMFHTPIRGKVENVENFVLACLSLQNYLRLIGNASYCRNGFTDSYDAVGNLQEGECRGLVSRNQGSAPINSVKGPRYSNQAIKMGNAIEDFVNTRCCFFYKKNVYKKMSLDNPKTLRKC